MHLNGIYETSKMLTNCLAEQMRIGHMAMANNGDGIVENKKTGGHYETKDSHAVAVQTTNVKTRCKSPSKMHLLSSAKRRLPSF